MKTLTATQDAAIDHSVKYAIVILGVAIVVGYLSLMISAKAGLGLPFWGGVIPAVIVCAPVAFVLSRRK